MRTRLADVGVAVLPFGLGLRGPSWAALEWALPLCVALSVPLYWRRRYPLAVLLVTCAVGLTQVLVVLYDGHTRAEERARIAREIHDIVAHSVSVMVVQSDGADAAIEQDNLDEVRNVIAAIGRTGRDALTELRLLLGVLRGDQESTGPQPGTDQLEDLIRTVPLPVRLRVDGQPLMHCLIWTHEPGRRYWRSCAGRSGNSGRRWSW